MTVVALNTALDDFASYSVATPFLARVVDRVPAEAARTALELYQEQVDFALDWARSEPALVAQYHREWLGC